MRELKCEIIMVLNVSVFCTVHLYKDKLSCIIWLLLPWLNFFCHTHESPDQLRIKAKNFRGFSQFDGVKTRKSSFLLAKVM